MTIALAVDAERARTYGPFALEAAPRLLSHMDREPHSATYASFDRDHWSWKFRDFPVLMTQWAMLPLALLARMPLSGSSYFGSEIALGWARAAVSTLCARQRRDGAWDTVAPNTRDHGGTLACVYYLTETAHALGAALGSAERERISDCVTRAVGFAARSSEDYAFISNHQALFALSWHAASAWLADSTLVQRAGETIDGILERQHVDGFYSEYGGFDPGYETLGIQYLARYWEKTGDARVLQSLRRAVAFFAHAVHPDGSVGGAYGSRHTRLYCPAGFEILASEVPEAAGVAAFMRARLVRGEVVTPANVDAHNAYAVTLSYLHACAVTQPASTPAQLPCERLRGAKLFSGGLLVAGGDDYYGVFALNKGGVCRIHRRAGGELLHEDAGWVVRDPRGLHASQIGLAEFSELPEGVFEASGNMGVARLVQLTPLHFLALRILNLTLFGCEILARWIRRLVIERLITRIPVSPYRSRRRIKLTSDRIAVIDSLTSFTSSAVTSVELARAFTGIHMGSAKYFHPSALAVLPAIDVDGIAERLSRDGAATVSWFIDVAEGSLVRRGEAARP